MATAMRVRPRTTGRVVAGLALVSLLISAACGDDHRAEREAQAVQHLLKGSPTAASSATWEDVKRFYEGRNARPAWIEGTNAEGTRRVIVALAQAGRHGLPGDYQREALAAGMSSVGRDGNAEARAASVAALDVETTTALLQFARDVAHGTTDPQRLQKSWKRQRADIDLAAALADHLDDLAEFIAAVQPQHAEYRALVAALDASRDPSVRVTAPASVASHQQQLALNLERWRWMPDDLGQQHILVNIPAFELRVREAERTALAMNVVVGKTKGHETPVFSDRMETVVFSPYWNVPERIATGETAPAAAKDPSYLERHGMQVFKRTKGGLKEVDADSVDWSEPSEVKQLIVRQRPGEQNALGGVKFLFPNEFDVYLHDTPSVSLFSRTSRAFSHGCVRVAEPEALAAYLLRDRTEWDTKRISEAMTSGKEQAVALKTKVSVHIAYFTAWVDEGGVVHYEPDVYGYDARQLALSAPPDNE